MVEDNSPMIRFGNAPKRTNLAFAFVLFIVLPLLLFMRCQLVRTQDLSFTPIDGYELIAIDGTSCGNEARWINFSEGFHTLLFRKGSEYYSSTFNLTVGGDIYGFVSEEDLVLVRDVKDRYVERRH